MGGTVTVVIPVYQGAEYLEAAVRSAVEQPEVERVVIADDGSTDGSWELAQALEQEHAAVIAVCHPGRGNRGVSVTRNLGARRASTPLIAFLDADDYYLPRRFRAAVELLAAEPALAGVYEPVGTDFSDAKAEAAWFNDLKRHPISWTGWVVPPERLFAHLCTGRHFHIAGVTLRRVAFFSAGGFNPDLRLSEDTELWLKLALCSQIAAASDRVVAMRRIHGSNTILTQRAEQHRQGELKWRHLTRWAAERRLPRKVRNAIGRNLALSIAARHRTEGKKRAHLVREVARTVYEDPGLALLPGYWLQALRSSLSPLRLHHNR